MKLLSFQVRKFRNIVDSTLVRIEDKITCLVGKNESGKTAALQALERLHPARPNVAFSVQEQYPAWLEKRDRMRGEDLEAFRPVIATFALEERDRAALDERFGSGAVSSKEVTVSREYGGKRLFGFDADEKRAVAHVVKSSDLPTNVKTEGKKLESFDVLVELLDRLRTSPEDQDQSAAAALDGRIGELLNGAEDFRGAVVQALSALAPRFLYFGEYSSLPGIVPIRKVLKDDPSTLDDGELTARALLRLAAADEAYLLNPEYEIRKRELENVANALTADVLAYWSTNPELRVHIDITQTTEDGDELRLILDQLRVRMWDDRHLLSLPFDERSRGFRWFFSFLAAFSEYEFQENPVIILLDEPALGLHARAQKDFLRFIEERLSAKHQVVYTTHSPFMVQPGHLERVRLVEDKGRDRGAEISEDVLTTDPDTLFPLQGALGYDMAQHLFIAPHNLVVEGTSDFTYLVVLSDFLKEQGSRTHLDDRWSVVPVGGADYIPTFVALLGGHLDVTVVVDSQKGGNQRLAALAGKGYLPGKRVIPIGEVLGRKEADIEDLFTEGDYLLLYNEAFGMSVASEDLTGSDSIVRRIARHTGRDRFDHGRPADVLLRRRDELLPRLDEETLTRFERLFERINQTLSDDA